MGGKFATGAVRIPTDDAVWVSLAVVLIREQDIIIGVDGKTMAIHHHSTSGRDQEIWHVLIPEVAASADDGSCLVAIGAVFPRCARRSRGSRSLAHRRDLPAFAVLLRPRKPTYITAPMITRDEVAELVGVCVRHGERERSARLVGQAEPVIAGKGWCVSTKRGASMVFFGCGTCTADVHCACND